MPDCGIGWVSGVRAVTAMPDIGSHARDDRPTPLIPLEASEQRFRVSLVSGVVWGLILALILGVGTLWTTRRGAGATPNVNVGPVIVAEPSTPTPLPIQVGPTELVPQQAWIRIVGLPASASLSEGQAIAPGLWSVPVMRLPGLSITAPAGEGTRSSVNIALVSPRGSVLAEAQSTLLVVPATRFIVTGGQFRNVSPPSNFEMECPEVAASQLTNVGTDPTDRWSKQEERMRAEGLVRKGDRWFADGDVLAAQAFYRRAAEMGWPPAAFALEVTYEPHEVSGFRGDNQKARCWYARARELADMEASQRKN